MCDREGHGSARRLLSRRPAVDARSAALNRNLVRKGPSSRYLVRHILAQAEYLKRGPPAPVRIEPLCIKAVHKVQVPFSNERPNLGVGRHPLFIP